MVSSLSHLHGEEVLIVLASVVPRGSPRDSILFCHALHVSQHADDIPLVNIAAASRRGKAVLVRVGSILGEVGVALPGGENRGPGVGFSTPNKRFSARSVS
jgi:hypothetical protein